MVSHFLRIRQSFFAPKCNAKHVLSVRWFFQRMGAELEKLWRNFLIWTAPIRTGIRVSFRDGRSRNFNFPAWSKWKTPKVFWLTFQTLQMCQSRTLFSALITQRNLRLLYYRRWKRCTLFFTCLRVFGIHRDVCMYSLDRDVLCSTNLLAFHNWILSVEHLNSESESYSGAQVKIIPIIIFFTLTLLGWSGL
jgi:hypothetical protein